MGTIVEKLLRIKETKTGFKDLIIEKGGVITETTTFHEYIDEARKLMEGGAAISELIGQPAVEGEFLEKIIFNTSLSHEEVSNIIKNANLSWVEESGALSYVYLATDNNPIIIGDLSTQSGAEGSYAIIVGDNMVYVSPEVPQLEFSPGWNLSEVEINETVLMVGPDNEKLSKMISKGDFSYSPIVSLSGDYRETKLWIAENQTLNIQDLIENNKEIPVQITTEIITSIDAKNEPVPTVEGGTTTNVPGIFFNTNLTPEEVDEIITNANLFEENNSYRVCSQQLTYSRTLYIEKESDKYIIYDHHDGDERYFYCSKGWDDPWGNAPWGGGWNPAIVNFNVIDPTRPLKSYYKDQPIGIHNEKLVDLMFVPGRLIEHYELGDNYTINNIEVTENTEINLTEYWDNGEMPVKINVNVEGSGDSGVPLQPATEEEMNNLLINENIGKFYKFTGESTDKYEKGAIYVVQDADNPIIEDKIKSIATEAEMDAVLVEENIGKLFLYAGETCDKYIKDIIYMVQNKENPIIDVPQPGVPLQPATEEEMNKLLVNENVGKVFLYTGETNENFTNGEYYIIEEVTE